MGDEAFRELSQVDPKADQLLDEVSLFTLVEDADIFKTFMLVYQLWDEVCSFSLKMLTSSQHSCLLTSCEMR